MPSQENIQQVAEIQERLQNSDVVILTDFKGLTVAEINELRDQLRAADVQYKVYKNTLINVAVQNLQIEGIAPYLVGPTALATSNDPAASAKALGEFSREHEHLQIKGGILGTRVIDSAGVTALVDMPSKEQLIARAIGGISAPLVGLVSVLHRGSPLTGLVNVLNGSIRQVVTVLQAITDQKKEAEQS
jgi:large subunit ribosomal protein L10